MKPKYRKLPTYSAQIVAGVFTIAQTTAALAADKNWFFAINRPRNNGPRRCPSAMDASAR
jgi:hypothetical protein